MATKTTAKRLTIEEQIKQLEQQRKALVQQERAEHLEEQKKRQLLRGGLLEKLVPHLATLSDAEFENYVKQRFQDEPVLVPSPQPAKPILSEPSVTSGGNFLPENEEDITNDDDE